jgi:hypothetical protein
MDKLTASIKARLEQAFPKADIEFLGTVPFGSEHRSVTLEVCESTARELESAALVKAREFFGPGPELHAEDGWVAKARYPEREISRYRALVTVHAHGELADPDDDEPAEADGFADERARESLTPADADTDSNEPEGRHRRRYPAEDVPGPDTLPEPEQEHRHPETGAHDHQD